MPALTPLTGSVKLDAINEIIETIDEPPASALDTGGTSEIADAERVLDRVLQRILAEGWTCNTIGSNTLSPSGGEITLSGVLRFERPDGGEDTNLTIRSGKLYNRKTGTFTFASSVTLRTIMDLGIEVIPTSLRAYVVAASRAEFWRMKKQGEDSPLLLQQLQAAMQAARREDEELRRAGAATVFDEAVSEILETVRDGTRIANMSTTALEAEARLQLERSNVRIQQERWACNTVNNKKYTPDGSDQISVSSLLAWRPTHPRADRILTEQNGLLYDATNETNTFSSDIYLDATILLAYDQLPPMLQQLITKDAAVRFQRKYQGDRFNEAVASQELRESRIDAMQEDLDARPLRSMNAAEEYDFTGRRNTAWTRPVTDL